MNTVNVEIVGSQTARQNMDATVFSLAGLGDFNALWEEDPDTLFLSADVADFARGLKVSLHHSGMLNLSKQLAKELFTALRSNVIGFSDPNVPCSISFPTTGPSQNFQLILPEAVNHGDSLERSVQAWERYDKIFRLMETPANRCTPEQLTKRTRLWELAGIRHLQNTGYSLTQSTPTSFVMTTPSKTNPGGMTRWVTFNYNQPGKILEY